MLVFGSVSASVVFPFIRSNRNSFIRTVSGNVTADDDAIFSARAVGKKRRSSRRLSIAQVRFCCVLPVSWPGLVWLGLAWLGLAWLGVAWRGVAWLCLAWLGLAWLGLAWLGLAWLGLAWLVLPCALSCAVLLLTVLQYCSLVEPKPSKPCQVRYGILPSPWYNNFYSPLTVAFRGSSPDPRVSRGSSRFVSRGL